MYADQFTTLTKDVVARAVSLVMAAKVKNALEDHTSADIDGVKVKIVLMYVSGAVFILVKPYTDKAVDRVIAWVKEKRSKKQPAK